MEGVLHNENAVYYCKGDGRKVIKYKDGLLFYSDDNGEFWRSILWRPSIKLRVFVALGNFSWPPFLDCIGFRDGAISIAWRSSFEDEINISKYIGKFNQAREKWSLEVVGRMDLSYERPSTWFEEVGFDSFTRTWV